MYTVNWGIFVRFAFLFPLYDEFVRNIWHQGVPEKIIRNVKICADAPHGFCHPNGTINMGCQSLRILTLLAFLRSRLFDSANLLYDTPNTMHIQYLYTQ